MRNKKLFRFLALGLLFLTGCTSNLPYRPVYPIDLGNISYNLVDFRDRRNSHSMYSTIPFAYQLVPESLAHLERGYVEVFSPDYNNYGVFSFLKGKMIVLPFYTSLSYLDGGDGGVYIEGNLRAPEGEAEYTDETQLCDLYDYRGNQIASSYLKKDRTFIVGNYTNLNGDEVLLEYFSAGGERRVQQVKKDGTRVDLVDDCWVLARDMEGNYLPFSSALTDLGMTGFTGKISAAGWLRVYHGTGWVDLYIPDWKKSYAFFWKCLFYQYYKEATSEDCDFEKDGLYYKLVTVQLQLATGHPVILDFPYYIDELTPIYDDEHVARYAKAVVRKIDHKKLADDLSVFIINNQGIVLTDVTDQPIYYKGTQILDNEHFITSDHKLLLNGTFAINRAITQTVAQISYGWDCIACLNADGKYSLLNFNGELMPAFASPYTNVSVAHVYNGCGLAQKEDGTWCTLDFSKKKEVAQSLLEGYVCEDLGNGYLRLRKGDTVYYRSYSWEYNASDPDTGLLVQSALGNTLFTEYVVDVVKDSNGNPYSFRAFYLS